MATLEDSVLSSLAWRCIGPHRGGRVVAVAGDVSDPMTFYFGACAGGVWKTTDGGTTWQNVSDGYFGTAAVGALAVAPADPNVLYAGTGEATIRNNVSHGDGVYRSLDGGRTWEKVLYKSERAGAIDLSLDPHNPRVLYASIWQAQRYPHALVSGGPESGLWRSTDGGDNWEELTRKPGMPQG